MSLINYDKLEKAILEMETALEKYDAEEKNLILRNIATRINIGKQKTRMEDLASNVDIKSIAKKIWRGEKDD